MYAALATPLPSNQTGMSLDESETEGLNEARGRQSNSSCVEFECEPRYEEVPGNQLTLNLTGLVPAISYYLVVFAFSNGSSLQSDPSQQITFNTQAHGTSTIIFS